MRLVGSVLALGGLIAAAPLASQAPLAVAAVAADARAAPGGAVVASLRAGTKVAAGATRGADVLVTFEGWVDASRLGGKRDSFPASVAGGLLLRLRASPSPGGTILAELRPGAGVFTLGKQGQWMRVRRSAWVPLGALTMPLAKGAEKSAVPSATAPPASAASGAPPGTMAGAPAPPRDSAAAGPQPILPGAMAATRATKVHAAPSGRVVADLPAGSVVQPLARDRGWLRVRVEGWVNERDLVPADSAYGAGLTAAELRADPDGTRGKIVRWEVQVLSFQIADPLRRELARDEPYLLARGPGSENALLYLAVPPSLLTEARAIPPLTAVIITARVRAGRSEPVGTPILDLQSIIRR